jgi:hypothetical protein
MCSHRRRLVNPPSQKYIAYSLGEIYPAEQAPQNVRVDIFVINLRSLYSLVPWFICSIDVASCYQCTYYNLKIGKYHCRTHQSLIQDSSHRRWPYGRVPQDSLAAPSDSL